LKRRLPLSDTAAVLRRVLALAWLALAAAGCASFQAARLYERGSAALGRGDAQAAIADLERAADLAPQASEVQNHLGLAYAAAGRHADAAAAFHRAVDLDCGNAAAQENLAAARLRGWETP
jgi:Flp pilus assembly protein TadD